MRPSDRAQRWVICLTLFGVVVLGLRSWWADGQEVDDLLLSDSAVVEVGTLTRVEVSTPHNRAREVRTTAVAAGREYEQVGLHAWKDRQGENVLIITHPDTDLWLMTTMDGTLSTEHGVRNGYLIYVFLAGGFLALLVAVLVHQRVETPRWDRQQARLREDIAQHPELRSRAELRDLGLLPGAPDHPGLPSRGD
ncbi:hypothetical protein [Sanguibacter sp. 25GB23B1]